MSGAWSTVFYGNAGDVKNVLLGCVRKRGFIGRVGRLTGVCHG